jgi:hypothetical protein
MQARRPPPASARTAAVLALVAALSLGLPGAAAADSADVGAFGAVDGGATGVTAVLTGPSAEGVDLVASRVVLSTGAGSASPVVDTVEVVDRPDLLRTMRLHTSTSGTAEGGTVRSLAQTAGLVIGPVDAPLVEVAGACSACAADGSGASGRTTVIDLRVGGRPVAVPTAPNSVLDLPGIGTLHVNAQVVVGEGPSAGVRVTALRLELSGPLTGSVVIAESVCRFRAAEVAMPATALGGVLLTALVSVAFGAAQLHRRRRVRSPGGP